ncbi:alpha/beta hydrolase [Ichthyenterobacterium magnum]|uniref:Putative alpha/beta superfamily hydrolase n=1 Tax=Ichthyenterobacterium magnum TaxID=1230530 RepID=A0A420DKH7_9FLAO|nr:alpha/beta hydrolase-fold protein [Ichthyenterobacterium magnum]RKE94667.1 putative alpha/beta superfamily hydrolase [Ichthyenterobacterium magnum]
MHTIKKYRISVLLLLILILLLNCKEHENLYIIDTLDLKSNIFKNTRKVRVLLPPDYYQSKSIHYPVLYLNDGVLVFHAYEIKKVVHDLINSKTIEPIIVVGIDNGASTVESKNPLRDRAMEYLPWADEFETNPEAKIDNPKGKLYPDFITKEVMPLINSKFRTKKGAKNTGLGGSSRGALISLYTVLEKPNHFNKLLLESPSLYVSNQKILENSSSKKIWPNKVYIGIGTEEGETDEIKKMAVKDAENLKSIILKNSSNTKLDYLLDKGGEHNFEYFSKRFPKALEFLYGTE